MEYKVGFKIIFAIGRRHLKEAKARCSIVMCDEHRRTWPQGMCVAIIEEAAKREKETEKQVLQQKYMRIKVLERGQKAKEDS